MASPCSATAFCPTKSKTWSAPPGRSSRTASTGFVVAESMTSVAPTTPQPGRSNLNENLAAHGDGDVHVVELEPAADGVENECLHAAKMRLSEGDRPSSVVKQHQCASTTTDIY
jgi:hypothetical protein